MSLLIKGGRIVTAADDYVADVFVDDERISLIGLDLDVGADRVIDAAGKYVLCCNRLDGTTSHFDKGMHVDFTVTAA